MDRRSFIQRAALTATGLALIPSLTFAQTETQQQPKPPKPPQFPSDLVRDFVGAGHNNLPKVKEMLAENPNLLYAMWDWGGGDFETAFEGAGHVGDAEIAEYLIGQGARPNIFVLTMLGKTAIVKPLLDAYPALLRAKGPHGYTLLHHAERGEEPARELFEYLQSKGLTERRLPLW